MRRFYKKDYGLIRLPRRSIAYLLIRTNRKKTMEICINRKAEVNIFVPRFVQEKEVQKFIRQKTSWIMRKIEEIERESIRTRRREFKDGESFLFLGKSYNLCVVEKKIKKPKISFDGQQWVVFVPEGLSGTKRQTEIKKQIINWYSEQAKELLAARTFHYARLLDVKVNAIRVKRQKSIWGSCNHRSRSINLNFKIIMAPIDVMDYVLVHELCHLKISNHSRRFWKSVEDILPDYKRRQAWIRKHSLQMSFVNSGL